MSKLRFNIFNLVILAALFLVLVGCTSYGAMEKLPPAPKVVQVKLALAPISDLPGFAQEAEPRVRDAYRFALANPNVLTKIPCYCGCGSMGHQHTLHCYIKDVASSGAIEFDNHAAGCGICVDITQDVMKMMRQGEDLKSIRAYVDAEYSKFAAPTNTPPIE